MKKVILSLLTFLLSFATIDYANCQTKEQIENLKTFSKAYGYVKYFHPSDEADKIDWDKFAIYGTQKIIECENKVQLIRTLNELFHPIAPTIRFFESRMNIRYDIKKIQPRNIDGYKITYWQHMGVDKGMDIQNLTYQSIRINRDKIIKLKASSLSEFGAYSTYLNSKPYLGKKIKFSGNVKLKDGSTGSGHLWVRVDVKNSKNGFFDNMDKNPIKNKEWGHYEIIGNVDSLATGIAFGCFLLGEGEIIVDNFRLYYEENEKWVEIPIKNSDFEFDTQQDMVSDKTWQKGGSKGYIYSLIDPDSYAESKSISIKKHALGEIIPGNKIFEAEPNINEVISEQIGDGISCIIPLVLYCTKQSTYPKSDIKSLENNLNKINTQINSLPLRLGDIVISWNVFQHFYPYFDVIKINWEQELEKALAKSFKDETESDFLITLKEFTSPLQDGHINVYSNNIKNYFYPSITWELIEDKLVITNVFDKNLKINIGDIVEKIEGNNPKEYFNMITKRVSSSTPSWKAYRLNIESLVGEKNSTISITINNTPIELLRNQTLFEQTQIINSTNSLKQFSILEKDIYYLNLGQVEMKVIDSLITQLINAKVLICDLRGYPKNTVKFLTHIINQRDDTKWMFVPQYIYPNQQKIAGFREYGWNLVPSQPHINAKLIFIIDGRVISYAESYMGYIENLSNALIVGQPSAGTNGDVNPFSLPGNYNIVWTGMKVTKQNGNQHHGIGIHPDIYLYKTIDGVKENRDEFLEKALDIAKELLKTL